MSKRNIFILIILFSLFSTIGIIAFATFQTQNSKSNSQNTSLLNSENNQNTNSSEENIAAENSETEEDSCIITIEGEKYNVQPLRTKHPGGDIFVCGTDMTDLFNRTHGDIQRMQPYKIQN